MRKVVVPLVAAAVAAGAVASTATAHHHPTGDDRPANVVETVIAVSGAEGTDRNPYDYDLLRTALVATDLAGTVAAADDVTVFAPNDRAFFRTARTLGYEGRYDEDAVLGFYLDLDAASPGLVANVLKAHVAPDARTVRQLRRSGRISTLLDGFTVKVRGFGRVVDAAGRANVPRIGWLRNVPVGSQIAQPVNRVILPISLS